jgi:hypothetical protein
MRHELKTDPDVFEAIWDGYKRFEIRLNDRDYQVSDDLLLRETVHSGEEMANGAPLQYTGREAKMTIVYILAGPIYGLAEGWVVMSIVNGLEDDGMPWWPSIPEEGFQVTNG